MSYANISTLNAADEQEGRLSLCEAKGYRLIPSRFPTIDLYRRVAPPEAWDALFECESMTNPRLRVPTNDGAAGGGQNWNQAPFAYANPKGLTFVRPNDFGVELYATPEGALCASIERRTAFLSECNNPPTEIIARMLLTEFTGEFLDVRGRGAVEAGKDCYALSDRCRGDETLAGIIFKSEMYPFCDAYAIFSQHALRRSTQERHFAYQWDGEKILSVQDSTKPDDPRKNRIDMDRLFSGSRVLG